MTRRGRQTIDVLPQLLIKSVLHNLRADGAKPSKLNNQMCSIEDPRGHSELAVRRQH
jgi:hypothetical protein